MYLLIAILPLLLFLFFEIYKGLKAAIYAAIIGSLVVLAINWFVFDVWDNLVLGETILICAMGFISLRLNDSCYFKLQPVIVGLVFGLIFLWFQVFDEPLIFKSIEMLEQVSPGLAENLKNPTSLYKLRQLSVGLIVVLFAHSGLVLWAAINKSTKFWFGTRLLIYPAVLLLSFLYQLII